MRLGASIALSLPPHRAGRWLGLGGIYLFAFSLFGGVGAAHSGLGLMLLSLLAMPPRASGLPLARESFGYALYLALWAGWSYWALDLPVDAVREAAQRYAWLGFLPISLIAAAIIRLQPNVALMFALVLTGFVARLLSKADWDSLRELAAGGRATFGHSSISLAAWCAVVLLTMVLCSPRLRACVRQRWILAAWWLLAALVALLLLLTQTRSVLLLALVLLPSLSVWYFHRYQRDQLHTLLRPLFAAVLLGLPLLWFSGVDLSNRWMMERADYLAVLQGDPQAVQPDSSTGVRVQLVQLFIEHWPRHPWLGAGLGSTEQIIGDSEQIQLQAYHHLHNSYLDIMLQSGVFGLLLFGYLGVRLWGMFRQGLSRRPEARDFI
jgi:O-antigen ligase